MEPYTLEPDAAVLRVEAPAGGATAATGAFRGAVSIDPGNLLVTDTAGPPADALQVRTVHVATRQTVLCVSGTALGRGTRHPGCNQAAIPPL